MTTERAMVIGAGILAYHQWIARKSKCQCGWYDPSSSFYRHQMAEVLKALEVAEAIEVVE